MRRLAPLACLALVSACAAVPPEDAGAQRGYAGTIQKVFRVVRSADDTASRFLARLGEGLAPLLRQRHETHQYVVRTPTGQILAQSDQEFPVGQCVRVIPESASTGPAFRYGEARVVPCQ